MTDYENDICRSFNIQLSLTDEKDGNSPSINNDEKELSSVSDSESDLASDGESDSEFDHNNDDDVCTKINDIDDSAECVCYTCYCGNLHEQLIVEQNKDPVPIKFANSKKRRLFFLENRVLQNSSRLKSLGNGALPQRIQQQQQQINNRVTIQTTPRGSTTSSRSRRQKIENIEKEEALMSTITSDLGSIRKRRGNNTKNGVQLDRSIKTDPLISKKIRSSKNANNHNVNDIKTPKMDSDSDTDMDSDDTDSDTSSCSSAKIRNDARKHVEEYNRRKSFHGVNTSQRINADPVVVKREIESESEDSDIGSKERSDSESGDGSMSRGILKESSLSNNGVINKENKSEVADVEILGNEPESQRSLKEAEESSDSDVESIITCVSDSCMEISGDEAKIPMPGAVLNYSEFLPLSITNNDGDVRKTDKTAVVLEW